ncbi:S8 family serine peptidase [Amycolatopsis mongoliensis]|uniref:S8 family serine peptidase n=1 Tax=Amycolatopsis mongoliensis TaxID=715475 RepID=A0A9Y2NBP2_9PSEU|nr:S8 family serine peptidase [Amycolatopsis sp. 4-36]WIX99850.1 S8 family serine peptidase [Amycolatopsis sp. 4-36]
MTRPQDFRLLIGPEPFDPIDVAPGALAPGKKATVVQFTAALTIPDVARLKSAYGLVLDRFIPNLAYLEHLDDATVAKVRADFLVRTCTALDPALKLAPWIPATGTPLALIVTLFDDTDLPAVRTSLTAAGARDVQVLDNREIGSHPVARCAIDDRSALPLVAALDDVVWVEPEQATVSFNVEAAQTIQSGTVGEHGGTIWDQKIHGEGQVIDIIEEGGTIDLSHCFFTDDPVNIPGPLHRKVLKLTSKAGTKVTEHAMFVAGIAAGDAQTNQGAHPHRGGAWAAKIVFRTRDTHLVNMLEDGMNAGATIHNTSWGVENPDYDKTARDADDFSFRNEDHVVVGAAAPFHGPNDNRPPGIAKNVLCVAAAEAFPFEMDYGDGQPGPTVPDGRRKPDLIAVGGGISSALLNPAPASGPYCLTGPPQVFGATASSWAAPNAAAAAALVRQYFTEGFYPRGERLGNRPFFPTGALIRAVLLNSTVDMTGSGLPTASLKGYPTALEGWGRIRLDRTLFFPGSPRRLFVNDVRHLAGLTLGQQVTRQVSVANGSEILKITLVWTDVPPAESLHTLPSRNSIRLDVEDPAGVRYLGNDIDRTTGFSRPFAPATSSGADLRNNVQMVIVEHPPAGPWRISLHGDLIFEQQGYALVVSGALK